MAKDEIAFAGCGIKPDPKDLTNQNPLPNLLPDDVVTAGDFPIVVIKSSGSNGRFTGEGYVTLPFLEKFRALIDAADALGGEKVNIGQFSRIRITFNNIGVNTDFKLISGEIVASYDPNWGSMIDGDKLVEDVVDIVDEIDDYLELNIFSTNNNIPEENSSKENTIATPITISTTNNPVTSNPIKTNPVNTTLPNSGQTNPVATNPTNTGAPSPSQTNSTIEPSTTVKSNFKSITLTARENKTNRIAKENETLYYVKEQFSTPKTSLALTIDPSLPISKIKDNVHWLRDETKITDTEGILKFTAKDLGKNTTITSLAGFPDEKSRKVNIEFVDKNAVAWSFVPPAVSQVLTKSFNEIDDRLQLLDRYVKIGRLIKMKVDPIKITGSKYNENDKESRHYKKMEVGSISGGLSAESKEVLITHPVLDRLSRAGIVDIGLFFKAAFAIEVEGGVERYILVEQKKYQKNNPFLKVGPKGSLTFGVKAELKVARDQVKFEAKGAVEVAIKGDGTYNFSTNTLVVEGYIPPAILFANIQIGTKGFIEFELVDFQKSVELTDKIPLYEISHKF